MIRAAIELRLSLLPYLYTCLHEAVADASAGAAADVLRISGRSRDAGTTTTRCWSARTCWSRPCSTPGATTRTLYLPRDAATPGMALLPHRCVVSGGADDHRRRAARAPAAVRARQRRVADHRHHRSVARRTDEPSRALRLFPAPDGAASRTTRVGRGRRRQRGGCEVVDALHAPRRRRDPSRLADRARRLVPVAVRSRAGRAAGRTKRARWRSMPPGLGCRLSAEGERRRLLCASLTASRAIFAGGVSPVCVSKAMTRVSTLPIPKRATEAIAPATMATAPPMKSKSTSPEVLWCREGKSNPHGVTTGGF